MAVPTQKSFWGRLIGSLLGFWAAGPWGAVFGFLLGLLHDRGAADNARDPSDLWKNYGAFAANREQAVFTMGVIVLGAKMAKSDGRVTREEVEAFKRVFRIRPEQVNAVGQLFDQARLSADGFEPYAFQLAHVFRANKAVLEEILSGLFVIAAADAIGLSASEKTFLKRVAFIFGFNNDDFARIAARSGVRMPEREPSYRTVPEHFFILGVSETDTPEQIKKAYRALIREHHPDKLMAQGMPPEFVASATEKMKRINAAYDTVCKLKGIK